MSSTIKARKEMIQNMESINRISKIPVVESGMQYAKFMYGRIKNSYSLVSWSLGTVEGGIQLAIDTSLVAVPIIEMPLTIVDSIVCKSLDSIEQRVPAINYPPEQLLNMTKQLVSTRIVQPVIKRADSVKQITVQEASKYSEIAATRLDTALNVADIYVDKYLPDATDNTETKVNSRAGESKTIQTIEHVNRFSKKLQRRLTKRTLAEARALRKQGADTVQVLIHLLDLAIKDPKKFIEKLKTVWNNLSQDEPENQVPPANLEQLLAMLTRESARRIVHATNYTIATAAKMPAYTVQSIHIMNTYASHFLDYVNKTVNLERIKAVAVARVKSELDVLYHIVMQLYSHAPHFLEKFLPGNKKPIQKPSGQPTASASTPKQNPNNEQNKQGNKANNKDESTPKKEVTPTITKKESKKKKVSKETPTRSTEDENSNSPAIENGSAPSEKN